MACCESTNTKTGERLAAAINRQPGHGSSVGLKVVQLGRSRGAMCSVCEFRTLCWLGPDTPDNAKARQDPERRCWAGHWPDADGIVLWGGFRRQGVPKGIRLRLGLRAAWKALRRHWGDGAEYAGCGCFAALLPIRRAWRLIVRRAGRMVRPWSTPRPTSSSSPKPRLATSRPATPS